MKQYSITKRKIFLMFVLLMYSFLLFSNFFCQAGTSIVTPPSLIASEDFQNGFTLNSSLANTTQFGTNYVNASVKPFKAGVPSTVDTQLKVISDPLNASNKCMQMKASNASTAKIDFNGFFADSDGSDITDTILSFDLMIDSSSIFIYNTTPFDGINFSNIGNNQTFGFMYPAFNKIPVLKSESTNLYMPTSYQNAWTDKRNVWYSYKMMVIDKKIYLKGWEKDAAEPGYWLVSSEEFKSPTVKNTFYIWAVSKNVGSNVILNVDNIKIYKLGSKYNANLDSVTITDGKTNQPIFFSPSFDPDITQYTVALPEDSVIPNFTVKPSNLGSTFIVMRPTVIPGKVIVAVKAVDQVSAKTYVFNLENYRYNIAPEKSVVTFGARKPGYGAVANQTVKIINTGNDEVTISKPTLGANSNFIIDTSTMQTTLPAGGYTTFVAGIKQGLSVGKYSENITISGSKNASTVITLNFVVYNTDEFLISASPNNVVFDTVTPSYTTQSKKTITIKNDGNQAITLTKPTSKYYNISNLSQTIIEAGDIATFTASPKLGFDIGNYDESIGINGFSGANPVYTSANLKFNVSNLPIVNKVLTFDSSEVPFSVSPINICTASIETKTKLLGNNFNKSSMKLSFEDKLSNTIVSTDKVSLNRNLSGYDGIVLRIRTNATEKSLLGIKLNNTSVGRSNPVLVDIFGNLVEPFSVTDINIAVGKSGILLPEKFDGFVFVSFNDTFDGSRLNPYDQYTIQLNFKNFDAVADVGLWDGTAENPKYTYIDDISYYIGDSTVVYDNIVSNLGYTYLNPLDKTALTDSKTGIYLEGFNENSIPVNSIIDVQKNKVSQTDDIIAKNKYGDKARVISSYSINISDLYGEKGKLNDAVNVNFKLPEGLNDGNFGVFLVPNKDSGVPNIPESFIGGMIKSQNNDTGYIDVTDWVMANSDMSMSVTSYYMGTYLLLAKDATNIPIDIENSNPNTTDMNIILLIAIASLALVSYIIYNKSFKIN